MWKQLGTWWKAEGDLARLRGLDDRLLADMGMARDDLRHRVHGAPASQETSPSGNSEMVCASC